MNPSNTCTTCGHDKSEHDTPPQLPMCRYRHSLTGFCTCTRFTPTADSTDELDDYLKNFTASVLEEERKYQSGDNRVHIEWDEFNNRLEVLERNFIDWLAKRNRRRDEERLAKLMRLAEDEEPKFAPDEATYGDTKYDHAAVIYGRNELRAELRAEFADTPTKREDGDDA